MSEHDTIRDLLPLAAAGALTPAEEQRVEEHVRLCIACSNELEAWRPIASELRRLPTPQPSPWLAQATVTRAKAALAEQAEHEWNRRVLIAVVAFSWLLTMVSMRLVPPITEVAGWQWAFVFLVPGPLLGAFAMWKLATANSELRTKL